MELPGLAGEAYDYFCRLPNMDTELAVGAALGLMDWVADGRLRIRASPLGPESRGPEIWDAVEQAFILVGPHAEAAVIAMNRIMATVEPSNPDAEFPYLPSPDDNAILVPAGGLVTASEWPQVDPPTELVDQLRALRNRQDCTVVRMYRPAWRFAHREAKRWARADPANVGDNIQRWTNAAALLAFALDPGRPIITADLLDVAYEVAIEKHEVALEVLTPHQGPPVPRENTALNPEIPRQ